MWIFPDLGIETTVSDRNGVCVVVGSRTQGGRRGIREKGSFLPTLIRDTHHTFIFKCGIFLVFPWKRNLGKPYRTCPNVWCVPSWVLFSLRFGEWILGRLVTTYHSSTQKVNLRWGWNLGHELSTQKLRLHTDPHGSHFDLFQKIRLRSVSTFSVGRNHTVLTSDLF